MARNDCGGYGHPYGWGGRGNGQSFVRFGPGGSVVVTNNNNNNNGGIPDGVDLA
jgi:hypothetical protein